MARQGVSARVMALDRARGAARSTAPAPNAAVGGLSAMIRSLVLLLSPSSSAARPLAAGPLAPPGRARGGAFPKPDRPVAEIVAPRWSSEAERDRAGEFEAVAQGHGHRIRRDGGGYRRRQRLLRGAAEPPGRTGRPGAGRGRHPRLPGGPGEARGGPRQRHRRPGRAARSAPARGLRGCGDPRPHVPRDHPALRPALQPRPAMRPAAGSASSMRTTSPLGTAPRRRSCAANSRPPAIARPGSIR